MLIRFIVKNFMSFRDDTEFSMAASKIVRHKNHVALCKDKRVLKGAFIFGANAAGKSNLINAIDFASNVIAQGIDKVDCTKKYFRIDNSYREKPSVFQFDIYAGGHFYSYGFAVSLMKKTIEEEWLYQIDDQEKCIFLRDKNLNNENQINTDLNLNSHTDKERFRFYTESFNNPQMNQKLFLTDVAVRSPHDDNTYQAFRDVTTWFSHLVVVFPESQYGRLGKLLDDSNERSQFEKLLKYFDTGIERIELDQLPFDEVLARIPRGISENLRNKMAANLTDESKRAHVEFGNSRFEIRYKNGELAVYRIGTSHGNEEDLFEFSDESDGTRRLFDLLPIFQEVLHDCVFIIDELDRSLHTKAVIELINCFYKLAENCGSQLIATTHDSNVMNLDYLRQDEIWFVEREKDHTSQLYSLNKFRERFDKKVDKEYLLGRYGAVPIFDQYVCNTELVEDGDLDA